MYWSVCLLLPAVLAASRGREFAAGLTGVLVLLGFPLLWRALRRDPDAIKLAELFFSPAGVAVAAFAVFAGVATAVWLDVGAGAALFLAAADWLWLTWGGAADGRALARAAGRAALAFGSALCCLLLAEGAMRLPPVVALTGGNTPGKERWERKHYDRLWESNPLRLRSFHLDGARSADTARIVALGDSFTWGAYVGDTTDLWPCRAEAELRAAGANAEAVNLAVCGFSTVNEEEMLRKFGWLFTPDVVVVQFGLNDALPSDEGFSRAGEDWLFRTPSLLPRRLHEPLDRASYLYSFLNARVQGLRIARDYPDGFAPLYAENAPGWSGCKEALMRLGRKCRARGVPALLALFPFFDPRGLDEAHYPYLELHRRVAEAAREAGLETLDLRPAFARENPEGRAWWALPCDAHPGVAAHRLAAREIAAELLRRGWIKTAAVSAKKAE